MGLNVLSLFDGISCGAVALKKAGVSFEEYYAAEIDKDAIRVSLANHDDVTHLGDVNDYQNWDIDFEKIDLVLAGSPCQGFSLAGGMLNFQHSKSKLYFVFEKILRLCVNAEFLLENVFMPSKFEQVITERLGVKPIKINSSLVSAQRRRRFYWASFPITQPDAKGLIFEDVLDKGQLDVSLYLTKKQISQAIYKHKAKTWSSGNRMGNMAFPNYTNKKSQCLTALEIRGSRECNHVSDSLGIRVLTRNERERLQTLPLDYTKEVDIKTAVRLIGNCWTVDVIAHILNYFT